MAKITYQNIENTVAECGNMGGIADQIYYAPRSHFTSLASKPPCEDDREFDGMNILSEGVDEMLPGKQLFKLYETMEKGSLKAERQGEIDGISHKINLTIFTPGLKSKSLAMLMLANQSWIFYVKTGNQMFRVGNNRYAAKMAADGEAGTGDTTAAAKGNTMSFFTYEEGFAGEVVDIATIEAMLGLSSASQAADFFPADKTTGVFVDINLQIDFFPGAFDIDLLEVMSDETPVNRFFIRELDVYGKLKNELPFTLDVSTSDNQALLKLDTNLLPSTIYEFGYYGNKLVSDLDKFKFPGATKARFTTT